VDETTETLDLVTAARRLGLTTEGVRKRLIRGQLQGRKVGGKWTVILSNNPDKQPDNISPFPTTDTNNRVGVDPEVVDALKAHITTLESTVSEQRTELESRRHEVEQAAEERAELRRLLGNMQMQLERATLPAPREPSETSHAGVRGDTEQPGPEPIEEMETTTLADVQSPRRPWWKVWGS
jgi:DNA-binding transcriptional MerR regulator